MNRLFLLPDSCKRDAAIDQWLDQCSGELGALARCWFEVMRQCGRDVRETLHDGAPTACVGSVAFGYVNAFKHHVNVGLFRGALLPDPIGLLEGNGKLMRHVKLRPEGVPDENAIRNLIISAYAEVKERMAEEPCD